MRIVATSVVLAAGLTVALVPVAAAAEGQTGVVTTQREADVASAAVSPSPTTVEGLLSGMVTEEIEPGVYRILDDGAGHDLVARPPGGVTIGPDGSVWLLRAFTDGGYGWALQVDALLQLGTPGIHDLVDVFSGRGIQAWSVEAAVDEEGVVWIDADGDLLAFDGTTFRHEARPRGDEGLVRWAPAGVARLADGQWTVLEDRPPVSHLVAASGATWYAAPPVIEPGQSIQRFDGDTWQTIELPIARESTVGAMALGPEGTLWVYLTAGDLSDPSLARYADGNWNLFGAASGVPLLEWHTYGSRMVVDGDGRLWIALGNGDGWPATLPAPLRPPTGPVGVLSFDGERWTQVLDGVQVNRVAIADDGSLLATAANGCRAGDEMGGGYGCAEGAADPSLGGLYVITPAALAATGS